MNTTLIKKLQGLIETCSMKIACYQLINESEKVEKFTVIMNAFKNRLEKEMKHE